MANFVVQDNEVIEEEQSVRKLRPRKKVKLEMCEDDYDLIAESKDTQRRRLKKKGKATVAYISFKTIFNYLQKS